MRPSIVTLVAGCLSVSCADDDYVCTQIGCTETEPMAVMTVSDPSTLYNIIIEVCVNTVCSSGYVPTPPLYGAKLMGPLQASVGVGEIGEGEFVVAARVHQGNAYQDGDIYTVSMTRLDGTVIAFSRWTATYQMSWPNGPSCGSCEWAELTPAP